LPCRLEPARIQATRKYNGWESHCMTAFVLVHGAWHGSWCWDLLIPQLRQLGHETVAADLPIGDPAASFDDYADLVVEAAEGHDDIVVVGHSWAGQVIPIVAPRRPVS